MATKLKTNLAVQSRFEPFYVSGKIEISKDAERIFSSSGNTIKIFSILSGQVENVLQNEESDSIVIFALNPVTEHLITASRSQLVREWNWKSATCLKTWKAVHHAPISCLAFDATGELLVTGSADSTVKVWHAGLKCHTHSFRGSQGVISVAKFHPETARGLLLSAADDSKIRVWSLNPSKQLAALEGHFSVITDFQFDLVGNQLISASRDKVLIVWNLETFTLSKTVPIFEEIERIILLPSEFPHGALRSAPGHLNILTGGSKGSLVIWDLTANKNVFKSSLTQSGASEHSAIVQLHFSPTTARLFVVLVDQSIMMYDLPKLKATKQFSGHNDEIFDVKFLNNNQHSLVATNSPRLKVYDLATADCRFAEGHSDSVLCISAFRSGDLVASGAKDCNLRLWTYDPSKLYLKCVAVAYGHTSTVGALVTSRSPKKRFIVSGSEDSTMKIWNVQEDKSPETGLPRYTMMPSHTEVAHEKGINSVALSPDDKWVASAGGDKTAKVWKYEPFGLKGVLRGHRRAVWCVLFAPHDQIVGTSSGDGTVKLWALSDLHCVKTFEGHDCSVMKLVFLSNGLQLLTSGSDGLLKLWDVRRNTCMKTFDAHEDKVWAIDVADDDQHILTGAGDSTFLLWKDVSEEEQSAEQTKQNNLILQEQELSNLLERKDLAKAFGLALSLDQPQRLLKIVNEILANQEGRATIEGIVRELEDFQIEQLLKYVVIWNTNSRHTFPAQITLHSLFQVVSPKRLLGLPKIKFHLEGLLPYTERHGARIDQLHTNTMFFRYLWNNVKQLNDMGMAEQKSVAAPQQEMEIGTV